MPQLCQTGLASSLALDERGLDEGRAAWLSATSTASVEALGMQTIFLGRAAPRSSKPAIHVAVMR